MKLFSRRNFVRTVSFDGIDAVRKHFCRPEDWKAELDMLRALSGRMNVPKVCRAVPGVLVMERLNHATLLDELERQERCGFSAAPWTSLCEWLQNVYQMTGCVPGDGNLRNFLWDAAARRLYGLDFEQYHPETPAAAAAKIAAHLLEYTPADTPVKRRAARLLSVEMDVPVDGIDRARTELLRRRSEKAVSSFIADFSFILLAGGRSRRMGRDKAGLPFLGVSLLEHQLEKARMLGVDDILISGARFHGEGARTIADELADRGPLGGLAACLTQAKRPHCIVLTVDAPLIPAAELCQIARLHAQSGVPLTLAAHGNQTEPLIGAYDGSLAGNIVPLIQSGGAPVRALMEKVPWLTHPSDLPDAFWVNCNTESDWQDMLNQPF